MRPEILIITGLSGSGKTVALRALEDAGFICVDNLPPQLIDSFASIVTGRDESGKIAVGIDIREKDFLPSAVSVIGPLRSKYNINIVFLEAERDVLIRRFKETRRPHPLLASGSTDVHGAISLERELLAPLRENADRIVDTSSYTPHQLREYISSAFGTGTARKGMAVAIISFGYKYGIPQNVDLLFDVRFLPNPHFVPGLRELKGTEGPVSEFVLRNPQTEEFMEKLGGLLGFLLPLYSSEGRSYLTIGIGCTGGKHRSPAISERVSDIVKRYVPDVTLIHRDM